MMFKTLFFTHNVSDLIYIFTMKQNVLCPDQLPHMNEPLAEYSYRDLFQTLPIGLYQTCPDGRFVEVNHALIDLLGYPDASSLLRIPTPQLYPDAASYQTYLRQMSEDGVVRNLEVQMKRYDGSLVWVEINGRTITLATGILCYEGSVQDISSRVQTWRDTERRYLSVVEKVREVLFTLDVNGRIQYVNQAWQRLTDCRAEDCTGKKLTAYFVEEDARKLRKKFRKLYEGEQAHIQMQSQILKPNNERVWVEIFADVECDTNGSVSALFGMIYDISERKKAEDEMKRAFEKERQLNELRTQFVSMTSHEFRTPLASILTSAELIEHYGSRWSFEKNLQHLKRIQNAVQQIITLMDDMLIIARSDAGKLAARREPTFVDPLIRSLIDEVKLNLKASHHIQYTSELPGLPAGVDKKLIRQIFSNMLSNALKYSSDGSEILVKLWLVNHVLYISVQDHGIGIPQADQKQLFESFFRASNVGERLGTGLGLAIVRRSAEAHGGRVYLNSDLGKGTIVTVNLDVSLPRN
jgi:PAS domain S-box-containing protein